MTCIKTQSMITSFINDKLSIKDMEVFLDHVNSCPICREELEFYYALLTAMSQLDEDKDLSGNFEQELTEKLEKAQEKILHAKYTYYRKKAILILSIILLALIISIGYADNQLVNEKPVTESDFRIRKVFRDERNDFIDIQLQNYLRDHGVEQIPVDD